MSFLNTLFGSKSDSTPAPTNTTTQQQSGPGGLPKDPIATTPSAGGSSNVQAAGDGKEASVSPLDKFTDIWKNDPNATNKNEPLSFNVDPQKLMEAAGKIDFAKVIKPEQLAAITAGGEGATQAFAQALNAVAQSSYAQSAVATAKIVEAAILQAEEKFKGNLPDLIKQQSVSNSLREENPLLSHEATAPILEAIQSRLTIKYPNATSREIQEKAKDYLKAFAEVASPKVPELIKPNKNETDWSKFLE